MSNNQSDLKVVAEAGIFIIENIISDDDCDFLMEYANTLGFKKAKMYENGRKNNETFIDLRKFGPTSRIHEIQQKIYEGIAKNIGSNAKINPIFEFYAYYPGDFIKAHCDASTLVDGDIFSTLTMVLYLNSDFSGGETVFLNPDISVSPQKGAALFFIQEGLLHEGAIVRAGQKIILRTSLVVL